MVPPGLSGGAIHPVNLHPKSRPGCRDGIFLHFKAFGNEALSGGSRQIPEKCLAQLHKMLRSELTGKLAEGIIMLK